MRRGTAKACFRNAAHRALEGYGDYYEGYVSRPNLPLAFLHAWTVEDGCVVDRTLRDPEVCEYLGVRFAPEVLGAELQRNQVYGLLDTGMINVRLLRTLDNALVTEAETEAVTVRRKMIDTFKRIA